MCRSKGLDLFARAAVYAAEAHASQRRKASDEPYINHLLRVAHAACECGLSAGLHDSVEDTHVTLEDLEDRFPPRVVEIVRLLSKWWPDDAPNEIKIAENPKYYGAILRDPEAVDVKLLDRADNLLDIARMLPRARRWAERYLMRTEKEVSPVFEISSNKEARRLYSQALHILRSQLRKAA